MNEHETGLLDEVRAAMKSDEVRLNLVPTFSHGEAVRVEIKNGSARWRKVGPLMFPADGGTTADVLVMLAEMRTEAAEVSA